MTIEHTPGGTVITGEHIQYFQMLRLMKAMELEARGLRHSQGSVYAHVKRTYGFRGSRAKVIQALKAKIIADFPDCPMALEGR